VLEKAFPLWECIECLVFVKQLVNSDVCLAFGLIISVQHETTPIISTDLQKQPPSIALPLQDRPGRHPSKTKQIHAETAPTLLSCQAVAPGKTAINIPQYPMKINRWSQLVAAAN
jgi:hypothetical protein